MTTYIESFKILGREYSIEDYKDGHPDKDHFFAETARKEKWPRYKLWVNGGSFGSAKTLAEARQKIHDYVICCVSEQLKEGQELVATANATLKKLGDDPSFLFRFELEDVA